MVPRELTQVRSADNGEVAFPWAPSELAARSYFQVIGEEWLTVEPRIQEPSAAKLGLMLEKKNRTNQKRITGKLKSPSGDGAGFLVVGTTFQGQVQHVSERFYTFADAAGNFTFDAIGDATYTCNAADLKFFSETIDFIPYDTKTEQTINPKLNLVQGHPLTVRVTAGVAKRPVTNANIIFRKAHNYFWIVDGERHNGSGGPSWGTKTDASGVVHTAAPAGELSVVFIDQELSLIHI